MRKIFELVEEMGHTPTCECVALGNGTAIELAAWLSEGGKVHIAIKGHGYYYFSHYAHFSYVMEKLFGGKWQGDAEVVASFINRVLGITSEV